MSILLSSGKTFSDIPVENWEGKSYLHEDLGCVITVTKVDAIKGFCTLTYSNGTVAIGETPLFLLSIVEYLEDV